MKRGIKVFLFILLVLIGLVVYGFLTSSSQPPQSPDWSDPKMVLRVVKKGRNYLIEYEVEGEKGRYYVGNSKVDLSGFVGQEVEIEGDFPETYFDNETNTQCIVGECYQITKPLFWEETEPKAIVIDIEKIRVVD